ELGIGLCPGQPVVTRTPIGHPVTAPLTPFQHEGPSAFILADSSTDAGRGLTLSGDHGSRGRLSRWPLHVRGALHVEIESNVPSGDGTGHARIHRRPEGQHIGHALLYVPAGLGIGIALRPIELVGKKEIRAFRPRVCWRGENHRDQENKQHGNPNRSSRSSAPFRKPCRCNHRFIPSAYRFMLRRARVREVVPRGSPSCPMSTRSGPLRGQLPRSAMNDWKPRVWMYFSFEAAFAHDVNGPTRTRASGAPPSADSTTTTQRAREVAVS